MFAGRWPNAEGVPKAGESDKRFVGRVPVVVFVEPNPPGPEPKAPVFCWFGLFAPPKPKPGLDVF